MGISDGQRATILIVEDLDWIRSGMKDSVRHLGYHFLEASDDVEAIEMAEAERPDLILTEEELPAFDSLLARIRQHPTLRDTPVVIINPDADEGTRYGDAVVLAGYELLPSLLLPRVETPDEN
ncbi:MAG TPA: response regulator [Pyrinomonadaceae bacterium]|nr:response regulator [Pyrinomonadaceae bacterium]